MKLKILTGLALLGPLLFAQGQQTRTSQNARPAEVKTSPNKAITVDDVKSMMDAGVPEDVIILKLRTANHRYDLSSGEIVMLKKLGASSTLLQVMLDPIAAPTAPTTPNRPEASASAASVLATTTSPGANAEASASSEAKKPFVSDTTGPDSSHEPGIYLQTGSAGPQSLVPLKRATMSNTRTKGAFASSMTMGISKIKQKFVVAGEKSEIRVNDPQPVFLFFVDEKAGGFGQGSSYKDPAAFALSKLDVRKGTRELTGMEMRPGFGVNHNGGDVAGTLKVQIEKIRAGVYKVTPVLALDAGEYAFSTLMGFDFFDFGVDPKP